MFLLVTSALISDKLTKASQVTFLFLLKPDLARGVVSVGTAGMQVGAVLHTFTGVGCSGLHSGVSLGRDSNLQLIKVSQGGQIVL